MGVGFGDGRDAPSFFFRHSVGGGFAIRRSCPKGLLVSKPFDEFGKLPAELQLEAIREGEERLRAQLAVASAADSRALTWGGLLVAATTGSLAGGIALIGKSDPDYLLAALALGFSSAILTACWKALTTVQPKKFCLPGNRPDHWLPANWECVGSARRKLAQARREQAEALASHIEANAAMAKSRAKEMRSSFQIVRWTIAISAMFLACIIGWRFFDGLEIQRPLAMEEKTLVPASPHHPNPSSLPSDRRRLQQKQVGQ